MLKIIFLGRIKMIPDRNLDLYIGRKSTRNVNHVGNFFF